MGNILDIRPVQRDAADWRTKHGLSRHPLYGVWQAMMDRCHQPHHHAFSDYGGRGITVCDEWHNPATFIADMGERPTPLHSLDRMDNNAGYAPLNCRWATNAEQQRNKRHARRVTAFGQTRHIAEWATITGVPAQTIWARIVRRGKTPEVALSAPCRKGPWKTAEAPV